MKIFLFGWLAAVFSVQALAEDSTALFEQRRKDRTAISFWCEAGRTPIETSLEGLNVTRSKSCSFGGLLDTKVTPLILEPPFLNPLLTFDDLRQFLLKANGLVEGESAMAMQFRLGGERFVANRIPFKQLKDTSMRLGFFVSDWGPNFISITGSTAQAVRMLADTMQSLAPAVFSWVNPHFADELGIWPRITGGARPYLPVELVPRCRVKELWNPTPRSLLLVGDLHNVKEARYFLDLMQTLPAAFAAIEISRDQDGELKEFLDAKSAAEENSHLERIVSRHPADIREDFKDIFRTLKRRQIPIVLMDYRQAYFNFPFTNTAFHGAIIAHRNKMWVERLPAQWAGTGVVMGGLAHFTDVPGSDLQNFLSERFPGIPMGLVNPLEVCN